MKERQRSRPRRRIHPLVVVGVVATVPALLLWWIASWATARADAADDAAPPLDELAVAAGTPEPALSTSLLAMRRSAPALATRLNIDAFREAVAPFLASLPDGSCAGVSVNGQPAGGHDLDAVVVPASSSKILTAAAALDVLGPDFRYETRVVGPTPTDGIILGDVYLVGGGDPVLSSDWYPDSELDRFPVFNHTSLDELADALSDAGVTEIRGAVRGDGSRYDDEFFAPGWGGGVAGLEAGPYDGLLVNDARVLGDDLRGNDPAEAGAREFIRLLAERGVVVTGGSGSGTAPADADELGAIESRPLSDIVAEMLTNSDNNTAEMVVKEIGLAASGAGTRPAGLDAITETIADWGIDTTGLVLADGSGLALDNRLTCRQLLDVLQRTGVDSPLGAGLPVAGETGTLRDIFDDTPVAGRLRGKTGTLNNFPIDEDPPGAKALAGYLPVDGGGQIEYVLLLNGPTIPDQREYRPFWAALATALASYPAVASPSELGPR